MRSVIYHDRELGFEVYTVALYNGEFDLVKIFRTCGAKKARNLVQGPLKTVCTVRGCRCSV